MTPARRALVLPLLPCLLAAVLAAPGAAALAAAPPATAGTGERVEVAALVERADGRLAVVHGSAATTSGAQALARRWRDRSSTVAAAVAQPVRALATTADPLRAQQWGLSRLRAEAVWAQGGADGQVVAVLDTGVDAAHPDLRGVVAAGRDLVQGSGNGQVDDNGHGTHVAGVVAALGGNGVGGAGLAPGARILPVRVLDAEGRGLDSTVAEGLVWAVDHGATVVNLSLGGPSPSPLLTAAVRYALDHGVVVVAASGNSGAAGDPVLYPAATPGVLAVGAVDRADVRPAFSSTGSHLAVVAPGVGVVSTVPGGDYGSWSGTSMAAPFAAAAAALVRASVPGLTPDQVGARLAATAVDLGAPGRDPQHGGGLLDVLAARSGATPPPATAPTTGAPAPVHPAPVAPVPVVEPAPAEKGLTVRTSRSAAVVTLRSPVVLSARVLSSGRHAPGRAAVLERRVGEGAWTVAGRATTGRSGLVSWRLTPDRSGEHRVLVGGLRTAPLRVDVRQAVRATAVRRAGTVVVDATVLPAGATRVQLLAARGRGWAPVATAVTDTAGRVRLQAPLPHGTRVRVAAAARPDLLAGSSRDLRP